MVSRCNTLLPLATHAFSLPLSALTHWMDEDDRESEAAGSGVTGRRRGEGTVPAFLMKTYEVRCAVVILALIIAIICGWRGHGVVCAV